MITIDKDGYFIQRVDGVMGFYFLKYKIDLETGLLVEVKEEQSDPV